MTEQPTGPSTPAALTTHEFGKVLDVTGDPAYYFAIQGTLDDPTHTAKYKVVESRHNRPGGRLAVDFTVQTWTTIGWQEVIEFKDNGEDTADQTNGKILPTPATAREAAEQVHRFLHADTTAS